MGVLVFPSPFLVLVLGIEVDYTRSWKMDSSYLIVEVHIHYLYSSLEIYSFPYLYSNRVLFHYYYHYCPFHPILCLCPILIRMRMDLDDTRSALVEGARMPPAPAPAPRLELAYQLVGS